MIFLGNCVRSVLPLLRPASSGDTGQGAAALRVPRPRSPLHSLLLRPARAMCLPANKTCLWACTRDQPSQNCCREASGMEEDSRGTVCERAELQPRRAFQEPRAAPLLLQRAGD